ncbi:MAG: hypothetical protein EBZ48_07380, partial [Proteobacteria bacterium]|nr:hypothetical protein [Pseudomonadota bacterium]
MMPTGFIRRLTFPLWELLLALILFSVLAGGIRSNTGVDLGVAMALGLGGVYALWYLLPKTIARARLCAQPELAAKGDRLSYKGIQSSPITAGPSGVALVVAIAITAWFLVHNDFTLQSAGNGDGAFHVRYLNSYISKDPDAYH